MYDIMELFITTCQSDDWGIIDLKHGSKENNNNNNNSASVYHGEFDIFLLVSCL